MSGAEIRVSRPVIALRLFVSAFWLLAMRTLAISCSVKVRNPLLSHLVSELVGHSNASARGA